MCKLEIPIGPQKFNKISMVRTKIGETKREGQRTHSPQEPKKRRELVLIVVRNYLTHNPSNVTYMQIVIFNNNERSRTNINC